MLNEDREMCGLKFSTGGQTAPLWTKEDRFRTSVGKIWDLRCTKRGIVPTADDIEVLDGCLMDVARTQKLHDIVALLKQAEGNCV